MTSLIALLAVGENKFKQAVFSQYTKLYLANDANKIFFLPQMAR